MSKFRRAKRVRSTSRDPNTVVFVSGNGATELQEMVGYMESIVADMKEFVVFLGSYPRLLRRQPRCSYLLLDNCMFGRQMERERVLSFLLQPAEAAPGSENLAVLPIVGPIRVGKSTLVENVCWDEMVRDRFSMILFFRENILSDGALADLRGSGAVKHQTVTLHRKNC
uniref:NB-ARC domain-containing protein n=1 Tax=Arundo donax TaxID=35708 RepID=A0A0A9AS26_ARUDO